MRIVPDAAIGRAHITWEKSRREVRRMSARVATGWYESPPESGRFRYWTGHAWTEATQEPHPGESLSLAPPQSVTAMDRGSPVRKRRFGPGWRKMTWVILTWSALMLAWIIGAAGSSDASSYCREHRSQYLSIRDCEAVHNAGTGIGVGLLVGLWFLGFVVLTLIWLMTRPKGRDCPVCGETVKRGRTVCPACGHDFAAAAGEVPQRT
jgi:hypothetical protein